MSTGFDSWHDIGSLFVIIVGGVFFILVPISVYGLKKLDKKLTGGDSGRHEKSKVAFGVFLTLLSFVGFLALCFYVSHKFL